MKYLAILALLLPLVYGAAVPHLQLPDADLVPDMSTAEDGMMLAPVPDMSLASDAVDTPSKRQVPPFRFMSAQLANADIDQVPDMSVAADAEDNETVKVEPFQADADLVPDMSVAADALDQVADNADLVPDMSVASDAE
ncbi:uncharacterized protein [Drosophila virilis]|uniref:Uncharacterized protein n=1 Tax=Drosophila virilis TaxID=7244 RepID=B4LIE4_DROVI|nr:uncharacterized protein LOC6624324 [Drosophila virilis]XP_032291064.1 uncharacterized protein LOC116650713 [Drosophila virilis]EDW70731.1 uncharacterized protein Dvir_GJ13940 [Drosophila virilis]